MELRLTERHIVALNFLLALLIVNLAAIIDRHGRSRSRGTGKVSSGLLLQHADRTAITSNPETGVQP